MKAIIDSNKLNKTSMKCGKDFHNSFSECDMKIHFFALFQRMKNTYLDLN